MSVIKSFFNPLVLVHQPAAEGKEDGTQVSRGGRAISHSAARTELKALFKASQNARKQFRDGKLSLFRNMFDKALHSHSKHVFDAKYDKEFKGFCDKYHSHYPLHELADKAHQHAMMIIAAKHSGAVDKNNFFKQYADVMLKDSVKIAQGISDALNPGNKIVADIEKQCIEAGTKDLVFALSAGAAANSRAGDLWKAADNLSKKFFKLATKLSSNGNGVERYESSKAWKKEVVFHFSTCVQRHLSKKNHIEKFAIDIKEIVSNVEPGAIDAGWVSRPSGGKAVDAYRGSAEFLEFRQESIETIAKDLTYALSEDIASGDTAGEVWAEAMRRGVEIFDDAAWQPFTAQGFERFNPVKCWRETVCKQLNTAMQESLVEYAGRSTPVMESI